MTDTNNGWPGKPGVPLNPEKDGWHWLESIEGLVPALWAWPLWRHCRDFWDQRAPGWMEEQEWRYHGPVLMPDEATALQSRIAELEAALATARREGMEEAARIAENEPEPEGEPPIELHGRSVKNIAISSVRATKHSIAAAIRAALEEGKKDER